MSRIAKLVVVALLLFAFVVPITTGAQEEDTGIVVGPALWDGEEGSRVTLCEVVGNTRPQGIDVTAGETEINESCIFRAELTATLDSDGHFIIYDVPPGWYLVFYEAQLSRSDASSLPSEMDTYDEVLQAWDGQTIPIGGLIDDTNINLVNFAEASLSLDMTVVIGGNGELLQSGYCSS